MPEAREGEGGGIVHALVTLSVTPEQIQQAQSELQGQRAGGRIRGPVMYKQGTFGLITSFKDPAGGLVTQLCGVGKAPALDGEAAAVSILLTKRGAQILWESMQTPTPDISFTFEMQMEGFRPPARAILEADFDQIYSHKSFAAGLASTHLGAEIELAFDDLRRTGGIKLTEIGDNADLHTLISTAYNKISQIMFETAPTSSAGGRPGTRPAWNRRLHAGQGEQVPGRQPGRQRQKRGGQEEGGGRRRRLGQSGRCEARRRCPEGRSRGRQAGSRRQGAEAGDCGSEDPAPGAEAGCTQAGCTQARCAETRRTQARRHIGRQDCRVQAAPEGGRSQAGSPEGDGLREDAKKAKAKVDELEASATKDGDTKDGDKKDKKDDRPGWAAIASFKMKNIRQSGR